MTHRFIITTTLSTERDMELSSTASAVDVKTHSLVSFFQGYHAVQPLGDFRVDD